MGAPRARWPLGRGFERFYGFLAGETDQYHPDLVHDNHQIDPPRTPEEGYHLTEDLADRAIGYINDLRGDLAPTGRSSSTSRPAPATRRTRCPSPTATATAAASTTAGTRWRERGVRPPAGQSGCCPPGTRLSERPPWVAAVGLARATTSAGCTPRMMEVYAGFLEHTDAQVGRRRRLPRRARRARQHDRPGHERQRRQRRGRPAGLVQRELLLQHRAREPRGEPARASTTSAGPHAHNHYPWGWAWAGNTPLKRWKRETHEGGVTDPLIVRWPARARRRRRDAPPVRARHRRDADAARRASASTPPATIDGVAQRPLDGARFAATFDDADAPTLATRSTTRCSAAGRSTTTAGRRSRSTRCRASPTTAQRPDAAVRRRRVGAVPRRRGLLRDRRPRRRGARAAAAAGRPVVGGGRAQPGAAAEQPARPPRRPPLPARPLRVPAPASACCPTAVAPEPAQPRLPHHRRARRPRRGGADGVIVTHGGAAGGYALYLQDRRLH